MALVASPRAVLSEEQVKPGFEFGLAAASVQVAAYPSSSVTSERYFLAPWFVYRSDNVQVKDGGIKLIAYESEKLTIDLGLGGSLNADTSETPLRDGMPDIDYLLELGPRFNVRLMDNTNTHGRNRLNWITAYRFALSTDFKRLDYRGPVLNTELSFRRSGLANNKLSFQASIGSTWVGNQLMDYFFSVAPEFETADRPQYNANGGFLGLDLSAGFQYKPVPAVNTFLGLGVTSLNGSKNDDSPLFEEDINTRVIVGVSWKLYQSKRTVSVANE